MDADQVPHTNGNKYTPLNSEGISAGGVSGMSYITIGTAGASKNTDPRPVIRTSGYPLKRYSLAGRSRESQDEEAFQRLLKSRNIEKSVKAEKIEHSSCKGRSWIYTILILVVACCFLAQAVLQGSIMMLLKHTDFTLELFHETSRASGASVSEQEIYALEHALKFMPWKLTDKFMKQKRISMAELRTIRETPLRPPHVALVCSDMGISPDSLYVITVAKAIIALGYKIELFTFEDGPMWAVWQKAGIPPNLLNLDEHWNHTIDWLNFDGIIINSLNAELALPSLLHEPFKGVPVIWIILEEMLGRRLQSYQSMGFEELISYWRNAFARADTVIFPDYTLAMMYGLLDSGNFLVIPGSPSEMWEAKKYMATYKREEVKVKLGFHPQDILLVVVGSPFTYKSVWREHAMVMKAVLPLMKEIKMAGRKQASMLKLIFVSGNSTSGYGSSLQAMAHHLGVADDRISHFGIDKDVNGLLWVADVVLYFSLRDEQSFPKNLVKAMAFGRTILAPNYTTIQNHMSDGLDGLFFPPGDIEQLTNTLSRVISNQGTTDLAQKLSSKSMLHASGLLVENIIVGYAELLENVFHFPSETSLPLPVSELPVALTKEWQWKLLGLSNGSWHWNDTLVKEEHLSSSIVNKLESLLNHTRGWDIEPSQVPNQIDYDWISDFEWHEEALEQRRVISDQQQEDELQERSEQRQKTLDEIGRNVKKAERAKYESYERNDGDLERNGQTLCVYEPYHGIGAWPFLHSNNTIFKGLSLALGERRPGSDDLEAASRLNLLNDTYYQNVLCEFGSFFSIAYRIDRVHKNPWIGFQSWRAVGRKVALSFRAEKVLRNVVEKVNDGDTLYFWARTIDDGRAKGHEREQIYKDFWPYCDAVNSNNCRSTFLEVFKQMYSLPTTWRDLPPMPDDGGSWAALHCWAMPTSSFLEFVMFSRMFVDALDSQFYSETHDEAKCLLGTSQLEVQHCYCRILDLLINVWAYHSGRKMIYLDPVTGSLNEQHRLESRKGSMWVKFFENSTLKGMDEDLAEETDYEQPNKRQIWPLTGEVFWEGSYEKERQERIYLKMEARRKNQEKLERIRSRYRQKPLAGG